ncbi:BlaI/MecI/CopY family transcriptional regulator [Planctomyces sp. SH-PL62]|uniref:BlaI/MecI/CopY family transcriptional regulator n=1 Tax=Planctomyces sp. SH-PL62 TaxID=1636152 RepID=UPI00078E7D4E|nr:BlaI/MecI/CopY family transcriptional regulator [Planctomyces sp. SH-PL62]AMV36210.1 Transcriptional regulator BlaI [Planctomyces sp. SH-PL62]
MSEPMPSLGELELEVLRHVWREQPCTERRVWDLVQAERPVARTTVLKTMQRLEEKGLLVREAEAGRGPIRYRAVVEERRVLPALIRRFVERALGGSSAPLAAFLAESDADGLTAKDLEALRAIARKIEGRGKGGA